MSAMSTDCVNTQNVKDHSLRILCYQLNIRHRGSNLLRAIKAFQASIALIRGLTPMILIILVRLYARTCKLISVLTRFKVFVLK